MLRFFIVGFFAACVAGCATNNNTLAVGTQVDASSFQPAINQQVIELSGPISASRKSSTWYDADVNEGLLPGRYVAALENATGTLFFGKGRPNFALAGNGNYYLRPGGIWVPKVQGESPKIFVVIYSSSLVTASSVEDAIVKQSSEPELVNSVVPSELSPPATMNQAVGGAVAAGIISGLIAMDDGKIRIYVPGSDTVFMQKLAAITGPQLEAQR